MAFLLRVGGLVGGLLLLLMSLGGHILRREPSTAFWVLGHIQNGDSQSLYLSSPNSGIRREIARSNGNLLHPVGWLSSPNTFFFLRQTDPEAMQLLRFDLPSFKATTIADHFSATTGRASFFEPIPHSDWHTIVLDTGTGSTICRISPDGTVVEPISPAFESISSYFWTDDGEWLYYIAGNGGNLTNGLYRQQADGSDVEDLMQFRGTAALTPLVDGSNSFVFTVNNNNIEFSQQVFRISPADSAPVPLTPQNRNFTLTFHQPNEWVILWQRGTVSRNGHLYRVRVSGEDLAPLYPVDTDLGDVELAYPIGEEDVIFVGVANNSPMLYRINVATLERETLTPPDYFTMIRNPRLIDNGQSVVFEGTADQNLGLYRYDFDDSTMRKIATLPFGQSRTNLLLYSENIGIFSEPIDNGRHTVVMRIDLRTGDLTSLVDFDTHLSNVSLRLGSETVGGILVTSFGDSASNSGFQQRWIDPATNQVETVIYGYEWRASPIIDTAWSTIPLAGLGIGLLVLSIRRTIWQLYQNETKD